MSGRVAASTGARKGQGSPLAPLQCSRNQPKLAGMERRTLLGSTVVTARQVPEAPFSSGLVDCLREQRFHRLE